MQIDDQVFVWIWVLPEFTIPDKEISEWNNDATCINKLCTCVRGAIRQLTPGGRGAG